MKEKPILFTGDMVRALLDGRKTQTRRIVKGKGRIGVLHASNGVTVLEDVDDDCSGYVVPCPYGQPGDRLWVREGFYCDYSEVSEGGKLPKELPEWAEGNLYYSANGTCCQQIPECCCAEIGKPKWRPSIFMPRWASRITLEITRTRVERLNKISAVDAIAEGTTLDIDYNAIGDAYGEVPYPVKAYAKLWESINGPESWELNPWVWVVEFKVMEGAA